MTNQEYRNHLMVMALCEYCLMNLNDGNGHIENILDEIEEKVTDRLYNFHGLNHEESTYEDTVIFTDKVMEELFHMLKLKSAEIGVITHEQARSDH